MRRWPVLALLLPLLGLISTTGTGCDCYPECSLANGVPPDEPFRVMRIWNGDNQFGPVGEVLPEEIVSEYRLGGVLYPVGCEFEVESGDGELRGMVGVNDSVFGTKIVTAFSAHCTAKWRLGSPGVQTVKLTLYDNGEGVRVDRGSLRFTAHGYGPATQVVMESGDHQIDEAGQPLFTRPRVAVRDAQFNGVPKVTVVFFAEAGSGTPATPVAVATDVNGTATLPGTWTLGSQPGAQYLQAVAVETDIGSPPRALAGNPARFTATATAPIPARIEIVDGNNQSGIVGQPVPQPARVRVLSPAGAPVQGVTVNFAPTPTGSVNDASQTTDANGIAQPAEWRLGPTPGAYTLTATAQGASIVNNPVYFTATAAPVTAPTLTLAIAQGDSQTVVVNNGALILPAVRVTNAQGIGVASVTINWAVVEGSASFTTQRATTDVEGMVSLGYFGPTAPGRIRLRASTPDPRVAPQFVDFLFTATFSP